MDLEQMKHTWEEMSEQRAAQPFLSEEQIRRITHERSSSGLNRIIFFESTGLLMTLAMTVYLLLNFHSLQSWLELLGGYVTLAILIISIYLGVRLVRQMLRINVQKNTYSKTLEYFQDFKKSLGFYKKMSIGVSFTMPIFLLPVISRLWFQKDILDNWQDYGESLLAGFILLPFFLYGIMYFYKKNVSRVSKALKDMQEDQIE
ncbi:MAG: hypothetical protein R8P61_19960 [Bacteroidia bacterium]|nr:hypothetical protein [Bacteroidia bacterium]